MVEPNLVKELERVLLVLKWGILAAITLLAAGRSSLEELRLILTRLRSSKALRRYLLADEDRRDIGVADKALKATELVKVLMTPYLAKVAPTK